MVMHYKSNSELPATVKKVLPTSAQTTYRQAFNSACEQYKKTKHQLKETAEEIEKFNKVAWDAVEKEYKKIKDKWEKK